MIWLHHKQTLTHFIHRNLTQPELFALKEDHIYRSCLHAVILRQQGEQGQAESLVWNNAAFLLLLRSVSDAAASESLLLQTKPMKPSDLRQLLALILGRAVEGRE